MDTANSITLIVAIIAAAIALSDTGIRNTCSGETNVAGAGQLLRAVPLGVTKRRAPDGAPQTSPLFDVERSRGYFDMAGFALSVEDELGVITQVATPRGLKLPIRDLVLREAVAL